MQPPAYSPVAAAQPGAQGDAGLRFGLFSPSLVRPRPLALALGASKKEQKRAGRQGPRRYLAVAVLEGKASVCTT